MEEWRAIPGYEGLYEASNLGRIRTAEGKTTSNARYGKRIWKQRVLKQKHEKRTRSENFSARVSLWKDGKENTLLVARLVALAWCDGYEEGMTVNHIDGDPLNDNAYNLEWTSLKRNINHGFDNILYANSQKPCVLIDKNGKRTWYRSQVQASHSIGRTDNYISVCKKYNRPIRAVNGDVYGIA